MKRLLDLGRLVVLAACLLCAGAVAVLYLRPGWVDSAESWLRHRIEDPYVERWREILVLATEDPAGERSALLAFSSDLVGVRKLDRSAALVRLAERRIIEISRRRGDTVTAIAHARRLVELDDRDLDAVATLGRLLGAVPATREEGIALLREAWLRVPTSPLLVPPLCELLAAAGDATGVTETLVVAGSAVPSNLWQVRWSVAVHRTAWFLPRRSGRVGIAARFSIADAIEMLRLELPAYRAVELRDVRLRIESPEGTETHALADLQPHLESMRWEGDALVAFGAPAPALSMSAVALPRGPSTFTLSARSEDIVADWLRDLLLGPIVAGAGIGEIDAAMARDLAQLRGRALARCNAELFWAEAGAVFRAGRSIVARLRGDATESGLEFTVGWNVPATAARVRIDLPNRVLARYRLVELTFDDTELDFTAVIATHDVEIEGATIRVTGDDPYLAYGLPASTVGDRRILLRGVGR